MQATEQAKVNIDAQNPDNKKKALIGNGILVLVLAVGIILAIFSWFAVMNDKAVAHGISLISNDDLDIRFNTYPGTLQADGTVVYDEHPYMNMNNPDFNEDARVFNLYPGERKYFKTVISNYETSNHVGNFTLQSIIVNKKLITTGDKVCITFASNLEGGTFQQSFDLAQAQPYADGGSISSTKMLVPTQEIYTNLTLSRATSSGGNVTPVPVTVYWYVVLNGDAVDNDAMGEEMMQFQKIKFVTLQ
ncbi:MAG: hypothetical protein E7517_03975 [Ruminococcaceae bacterium]|nr:hypothetical protein [Oscillospiraceae bacterium]